jgi:hypothetical protein
MGQGRKQQEPVSCTSSYNRILFIVGALLYFQRVIKCHCCVLRGVEREESKRVRERRRELSLVYYSEVQIKWIEPILNYSPSVHRKQLPCFLQTINTIFFCICCVVRGNLLKFKKCFGIIFTLYLF